MALYYSLANDGSFTTGDSETGLTCYAFPTSSHATKAKRMPLAVAGEMMRNDNGMDYARKSLAVKHYDRVNWKRIHDNTLDHTDRGIIDTVMERYCIHESGFSTVPFSHREG